MAQDIKNKSIMQSALGDQWDELPLVLQRHYMAHPNPWYETGWLTIDYPRWMQWPLNLLKFLGALINRRAVKVSTTIRKQLQEDVQLWSRSCVFEDGREIKFVSKIRYAGGRQIIEHVNTALGLRMEVFVKNSCLYYRGVSYVLKLGRYSLDIPNSLGLGCLNIKERAIDDKHFSMHFQLKHPLFGLIYQYSGLFETEDDT